MEISDANLKQISIQLIKGHLMNMRLINGLQELGFCAQHCHYYLDDAIFKLMGINDEKAVLLEAYLNWCSKFSKEDILKNEGILHTYAEKIYNMLLMERAF